LRGRWQACGRQPVGFCPEDLFMMRWFTYLGIVALVYFGIVAWKTNTTNEPGPGSPTQPKPIGLPLLTGAARAQSPLPPPSGSADGSGPAVAIRVKGTVGNVTPILVPDARFSPVYTQAVPATREGPLLVVGSEIKPGDPEPPPGTDIKTLEISFLITE